MPFAFSRTFCQSIQWRFPEAAGTRPHNRLNVEAGVRIPLTYIGSLTLEICKWVIVGILQ